MKARDRQNAGVLPSERSFGLQAFWRPRQPLLELALLLALGILLGDRLEPWAGATRIFAASLFVSLGLAALLSADGWRRTALFWFAALMFGTALQAKRINENPSRQLAAMVPAEGVGFAGNGLVDEDPVPGRARAWVKLEGGSIHGQPVPAGGRLIVHWPKKELPAYGDRVEFRGNLRNLGRARNPGGFDTLPIRKRQGVYSEVSVRYPRDVEVTETGQGNAIIATALRCRRAMESAMSRGIEAEEDVVAVIQSTVLGTQADAREELLDLFRNTGTFHLFSVSGLHVAMLAAMVFALFRALAMPRRMVALLVIPVLWGYCFITGLPPGSVRATVMGTVAMLGIALERPALAWNGLGAAAVGILLIDPDQLFRPGFQLSFLLVAALLAWAGAAQRRLTALTHPDSYLPRSLWSRWQRVRAKAGDWGMGSLAVSLVAWISSVPVTLWYFNLWSPSTVPANLVAVFLSWFILALGLVSGIFGGLWTGLAIWLNEINAWFTRLLIASLACFAAVPGAHRFVEWPEERGALCEIESIDLAGGAAIYLRMRSPEGTRHWLIDCGSANQFRWTLLPYLRTRGVNRLDGLIVTHGDSRHLGGALSLMEHLPIDEVADSIRRDRSSLRRALQKEMEKQQLGRTLLSAGDQITLAPGAVLHVLHPPPLIPLRTSDDKALTLRLDLSGGREVRRVLFTSDAGFTTGRLLLEQPEKIRADVWIKGMHAQDSLGESDLLHAIKPSIVVVNSAAYPRQQQPTSEWTEAVTQSGAELYLQHETGAVRIDFDRDGQFRSRAYLLRNSSR